LGLEVSDAVVQAMTGRFCELDQSSATPAYGFETGRAYSSMVYGHTSAMLETLRRVYGERPVLQALGRYARKFRFGHPTPDDMLAAFEEVMGPRVRENLRVGLFERGWVDYVVTTIEGTEDVAPRGIFDKDSGRTVVDAKTIGGGFRGTVVVTRRGTLRFPVDIELTLGDGRTHRVRWDGEEEVTRIPYEGKMPLRAAVVDPDEAVVLDHDRTNNHGTVHLHAGGGAGLTSERMLYWFQLLAQMVSS
jgi:hypothetical protein